MNLQKYLWKKSNKKRSGASRGGKTKSASRNARSSATKNTSKKTSAATKSRSKRSSAASKTTPQTIAADVKRRFSKSSGRGKTSKHKKAAAKKKRTAAATVTGPPDTWYRRWWWYMHPRRFRDWWFTKPGLMAALRIAGAAAGVMVVLILGLFLYFARDLPTAGQINAATQETTTTFYDRTGEEVLYEVFGDEDRRFVELEEINQNVVNATIAIEDRKFYDQGAFSSLGIIRASVNNVLNRDEGLQGGSTITQQYVKNALLSHERTFTRKIRELIIAMQMEELFEKDEIIELYLNEIGYGAQAYGVQAASQMYFSKDASELDIVESAMLAALPQAPTYYSPYGQNTDALTERTHTVIDLMEEQDYISSEEAEAAKEEDLLAKVNDTPDAYRDIKAPHFVLNVQQELEAEIGSQEFTQGGYEVITTIDMDKQRAAEKAVSQGMAAVENGGGNNAALVSTDPKTGQVLAMVGSRDFEHPGFGSYNAATALRQPGSSFKPYVYAQAFDDTENWGAGSIMYDVPTDFGNYRPNNFDNSYRDNITVRQALAESRNIPAVKMLYIVGLQNTLQKVQELGISTLSDPANYGLSLVLGAGEVRLDEHANAYGAFATGGVHHEQTKVLEVRDNDGNVIEEWQESDGERVFDQQTAYLMSDILSDDNARAATFGYNSANLTVPGHDVAIKTGTTDDLRDGWMMGYTPSITAGVWTGHNDNEPMAVATSNMTGPIFTQYMETVLEGTENEPFQRPEGLKQVELDRYTGNIASDDSRETVTDLFPSWYQPSGSDEVETAVIDTVSGDLATDCTPERAREEISSVGLEAEIPRDDPAFPRWNAPVQDLAERLDFEGGGNIPEEESDTHQDDNGNCTEPAEIEVEAVQDGGEIDITIEVTETDHKVDEVILRYNGNQIQNFSRQGGNPQTYTHQYEHSGEGDYTFEAEVIDEGLHSATASDTEEVDDDMSGLHDDEAETTGPGNSGNQFGGIIHIPSIFWRTRLAFF